MSILHLLSSGNFIVVNRALISAYGLDAAVMLGELASEYCYWEAQGEAADGWFYSTIENVEKNTGLTAHSQRQALNSLIEAGIIETEKKGMPAKRYIRINEDAVVKNFNNKSLKILTTSDQKNERQVGANFNANNNKTNKNKEKELRIYIQTLETVPVIAENPSLKTAFIDFVKMRAFIKHPIDEGGLKRIVNKVYSLGNGDPSKMRAILDQSIENSWRGVFPLREQGIKQATATGNEFTALLEKEDNTGDEA